VRYGDGKGGRLNFNQDPHGPLEIYNLKDDVAEAYDLAGEHPDIVEKINAFVREAHEPHCHLFTY